jgi:transposase-like protein
VWKKNRRSIAFQLVEAGRGALHWKETTAMKKGTTDRSEAGRVCWENLDEWVRERVQGYVQDLLDEEVGELLGRARSQRRAAVDAAPGYRNGYGRPRKLTLAGGTITLRRPRVRELEERFESRILPLFAKRTQTVSALLPELYLHGLAEGDFDLALRGLLGEDAPLSAATIARLKNKWQAEYEAWATRSLSDLDLVYLWADGLYVKAGLEKEKAALLVVIGALSDGRKVILAVRPGYRESTESWAAVLRDLKTRGLNAPRLLVADGHLGIWGALATVYPTADEQRCWNHRILNVLDKLPQKTQKVGRELLTQIPYAESRKQAQRRKRQFQAWCRRHGYDEAAALLDHDWERMVSFYRYPKEHWIHLRTTNVVESPFAAVRLRTAAAKRYKKVANATAVIWKVLLLAERRFRKLNAPHLLKDVFEGERYVDGVRESKQKNRTAAA